MSASTATFLERVQNFVRAPFRTHRRSAELRRVRTEADAARSVTETIGYWDWRNLDDPLFAFVAAANLGVHGQTLHSSATLLAAGVEASRNRRSCGD